MTRMNTWHTILWQLKHLISYQRITHNWRRAGHSGGAERHCERWVDAALQQPLPSMAGRPACLKPVSWPILIYFKYSRCRSRLPPVACCLHHLALLPVFAFNGWYFTGFTDIFFFINSCSSVLSAPHTCDNIRLVSNVVTSSVVSPCIHKMMKLKTAYYLQAVIWR